MALTEVNKFAKMFGDLVQTQNDLKDNLSGDEFDSFDSFRVTERVIINGRLIINKKLYPTTSFILDHPVYGELDNVNYEMDGGYVDDGAPFPLAFAFTFGESSSIELFRTTW